LAGKPGLPAGTPNPSFYDDSSGAMGFRNATLSALDGAISQYLVDAGSLTDELEDDNYHASTGMLLANGNAIVNPLDERILPEGTSAGTYSYGQLQSVRANANLALHALALYDTAPGTQAIQRVLRGELYAVSGYAEILLADLFCSGVPLSTLDFHQDFTYAPSSRWDQVYRHASVLLDSALQLAPANDSVLNLARVLKGRTQLALGNYAAAADDVALVPTAFQYRLTFETRQGRYLVTVADREGGNGLPYRSSGDPRTATTIVCLPGSYLCSVSDTLTTPVKYASVGYAPFVVANGIEARLIEAEAALQANPSSAQWLTILNALRTNGTGGVNNLTPLADSGATLTGTAATAARVAELFHERAYWLFLTGHRQGDLRRLLRQYSQYAAFHSQAQVYPNGRYPAPGNGLYGQDFTVPIPTDEYSNPNYHGCLNRDDH
jgi:hypothetical protein